MQSNEFTESSFQNRRADRTVLALDGFGKGIQAWLRDPSRFIPRPLHRDDRTPLENGCLKRPYFGAEVLRLNVELVALKIDACIESADHFVSFQFVLGELRYSGLTPRRYPFLCPKLGFLD